MNDLNLYRTHSGSDVVSPLLIESQLSEKKPLTTENFWFKGANSTEFSVKVKESNLPVAYAYIFLGEISLHRTSKNI